jgi:hypothetical protein
MRDADELVHLLEHYSKPLIIECAKILKSYSSRALAQVSSSCQGFNESCSTTARYRGRALYNTLDNLLSLLYVRFPLSIIQLQQAFMCDRLDVIVLLIPTETAHLIL